MTPEEHYERGEQILKHAEEIFETDPRAAEAGSIIAQGHFSAAGHGAALISILGALAGTTVPHPFVPVGGDRP